MSDYNIPEEELNFSSFTVEDITKTINASQADITKGESEEVEETTDTNQPVNVLTNDDISATTNGEKEEGKEETTTEEPGTEGDEPVVEQPTYDEEVYAAAIQLAKENGLLHIPEEMQGEVTDEVWQEILQQNELDRQQRTINNIRNSAGDPKIVELLDYVMGGGDWYGFNDMKEAIQEEIDISSLNEETEEDQRYLIELYLSDGLDANNPAHVRRLQNIDNEVNIAFERLENEALSKEAKQYLLAKNEASKQSIVEQQKAYKVQQQEEAQRKQAAQQNWNNQFKTTLNDRSWSQNKKDEIVSQFDIVQLNDGTEMEMWQYKFDAIWRDPAATQVFMDFMTDFDPNSLQFKKRGQPATKQANSIIKNLLNKKVQPGSKSQHTSNRRVVNKSLPIIDPNNP
jgi:hypothetical protein